jgi:hypothetical protein
MSQATKVGHLETYKDTNVISPKLPEVSAYFVDQTSAGGAYGFASAAEVQTMIYTVNALVDALLNRKAVSAS